MFTEEEQEEIIPRFHKAVLRRCAGHPEAADAQGLYILR